MAKKEKKEKNDTNMVCEVDGDTLTITVDLSEELRDSQSGRSTIIADSKNFMTVEGEDDAKFGVKLIVTKKK